MMLYFIKSGLCLGCIWGIYQLLFAREKMLYFNRCFLLLGLCFSFAVPFMTLDWGPVELVEDPMNVFLIEEPMGESKDIENKAVGFSWEYWLGWLSLAYSLVVVLLSARFLYRLKELIQPIRIFPKVNYQGAKLVLVPQEIRPYTFGQYIFVSAKAYEANLIEPELYTHELAHAHQWHTIDILLVELFQVLCWFNPILYYYKRAIQLNHEFLADDQVIKVHQKVVAYQELLLDKIKINETVALTSNFNFLITKKRLKMMTKITSWSRALSLGIVAIPMFWGLLLLFGNPVAAQTQNKQSEDKRKDAYFEKSTIVFKNASSGTKVYKPYADLSPQEKQFIPPPPNPTNTHDTKPLPAGTLVIFSEEHGDLVIKHPSKGAKDGIPPPPPPPSLKRTPPPPPPASAKMLEKYNTIAKKYNGQSGKNKAIEMEELTKLIHIYVLMTEDQKKTAEPFPTLAPVSKTR